MKTWNEFFEESNEYDETDEMIAFNQRYSEKDKMKMLLWMAGVTDTGRLDYADDKALNSLFIDVVLSNEFTKILKYMRS